MMTAITNDSRYQAGVDMIADNHNLRRQNFEMEKRVEFWQTMYEQKCRECERLADELREQARLAGLEAEYREAFKPCKPAEPHIRRRGTRKWTYSR